MHTSPIISELPPGGAPRRRSSRQKIETLVYADFGPGNGGFPLNLSEEGMAFQGILPLEKEQVIQVKFKLPDTNDAFESAAQVAWLNELGTGGGLQFLDLPEESRRPIIHWLSLHMQPGKHDENNSVVRPQVEKKISHVAPRSLPDVHEAKASPKAEANSTIPLPPSLHQPLPTPEVTARIDSTRGFLSSPNSAQAMSRWAGSKRNWILPFSIGVITSGVILVAILFRLGVISVQFHLPQQVSRNDAAQQAAGSGDASAPKTPSQQASINGAVSDRLVRPLEASSGPSATGAQVPAAAPVPSKAAASESSPAKTATPPKSNSAKSALQQVTAAKLMAPHMTAPAGTADSAPPALAPPTRPELAPQLPMIASQTLAPAPPVNPSARQTGKFDQPQLITRIDPIYPQVAKQTHITGSVELHFTITTAGTVRDVSVASGNSVLVRAAVDAVKAWRYKPARLDGTPVETQSSSIFNFKPN